MNRHLRDYYPQKEVECAKRIRAMGHSARTRILFQLWAFGPTDFNKLWKLTQESKTSCSFHIKMLKEANLIIDFIDDEGNNQYGFNFKFENEVVVNFDMFLDDSICNLQLFEDDINVVGPGYLFKLKSDYKRIKANRAFEMAKKLRSKYGVLKSRPSG
jgi:hypothetical protein